MRFQLRTLLGLITVACVLMAVGLSIINHRNRLREHSLTFLNVGNNVSSLDSKLRRKLLRMPTVVAQLQRANPVDPPMALGQSITGESKAFGTYEFTRSFHYDWQLPNGTRCEGIKVTVNSVLKEDAFEDHVVRLTYETSKLNDEVASWIGDQLARNAHVQVRHIKLRHKPSAVQEPASEEDAPSNGRSILSGVR